MPPSPPQQAPLDSSKMIYVWNTVLIAPPQKFFTSPGFFPLCWPPRSLDRGIYGTSYALNPSFPRFSGLFSFVSLFFGLPQGVVVVTFFFPYYDSISFRFSPFRPVLFFSLSTSPNLWLQISSEIYFSAHPPPFPISLHWGRKFFFSLALRYPQTFFSLFITADFPCDLLYGSPKMKPP